MISTSEALTIIQKNIEPLNPVQRPLLETLGLTLAKDVYAVSDIPAYPQSSMDGYALMYKDWMLHQALTLEGEVAAGHAEPLVLGSGKAVRIFTGAAVPPGADTVVMQEKIRVENGKLAIDDAKLQKGDNVRPLGSEIRAGELAMPKGSHLRPAAIGFLAGIGITEATVYPHPTVSIIVSGNELQLAGSQLKYGQVYESNSLALSAALQQMHIRDVTILRVPDEPDALTQALQQALDSSDLVLLTGGVSVGDYDFVLQAANRCGIATLFHKIKQRPGKPLYFGKKAEKVVFGLPGNPSSALSCFYLYVTQALELLSNRSLALHSLQVPLGQPFKKNVGLTHFLKGFYDGRTATPLGAQQSYRMHSFAQANCLIQIEEEVMACMEGDLVHIHLLPI